jgi:hypothetical protein
VTAARAAQKPPPPEQIADLETQIAKWKAM